MAPFCSFCSRLGGNAPKSEAATGLARAIFIRHLPILDGYAPKNHWILGRVTGWSCSGLRKLTLTIPMGHADFAKIRFGKFG